MAPGDEVIRIIRSSDSEIMCFSNEGAINVLGVHGLEEIKSGTIFSLKNEDYIDLLLIKSREGALVLEMPLFTLRGGLRLVSPA